MKLRIMSDLHLEWSPITIATPDQCDVLILAGDISAGNKGIKRVIETFKNWTVPIFYIPGNHEYYGGALEYTLKKMREGLAEAEKPASLDVRILEREEVILNGVRFLGSTLWTDYRLYGNAPLSGWSAEQGLNDFKRIKTSTFNHIRAEHFAREHHTSREWLKTKLAEPFQGKTVVISHHAPSPNSIHERYKGSNDVLNPCYASDLDFVMALGADVWVHGHVHHSNDYVQGTTRVISNPRGYVGYGGAPENPDFNSNFSIDL